MAFEILDRGNRIGRLGSQPKAGQKRTRRLSRFGSAARAARSRSPVMSAPHFRSAWTTICSTSATSRSTGSGAATGGRRARGRQHGTGRAALPLRHRPGRAMPPARPAAPPRKCDHRQWPGHRVQRALPRRQVDAGRFLRRSWLPGAGRRPLRADLRGQSAPDRARRHSEPQAVAGRPRQAGRNSAALQAVRVGLQKYQVPLNGSAAPGGLASRPHLHPP